VSITTNYCTLAPFLSVSAQPQSQRPFDRQQPGHQQGQHERRQHRQKPQVAPAVDPERPERDERRDVLWHPDGPDPPPAMRPGDAGEIRDAVAVGDRLPRLLPGFGVCPELPLLPPAPDPAREVVAGVLDVAVPRADQPAVVVASHDGFAHHVDDEQLVANHRAEVPSVDTDGEGGPRSEESRIVAATADARAPDRNRIQQAVGAGVGLGGGGGGFGGRQIVPHQELPALSAGDDELVREDEIVLQHCGRCGASHHVLERRNRLALENHGAAGLAGEHVQHAEFDACEFCVGMAGRAGYETYYVRA